MKAVIELTLVIPCDRCLEDVEKHFCIETDRELDMRVTEEQRIEALDEMNFISGSNLDVDSFVYGNRCGTNLNHGSCSCDAVPSDPRMAKILEVFKNSK